MKLRLAIPVALAVTALAGCGGGSGSGSGSAGGGYRQPGTTTKAAAAVTTDAVKIADFKVAPEKVTVDAGTKVTFDNTDSAKHTATAEDKSFDTGTLAQGETRSVTLDKPGTYTYYCAFHRFMEGEIDVK
jgi:plastocyanin